MADETQIITGDPADTSDIVGLPVYGDAIRDRKELDQYLDEAYDKMASDLHLLVGVPPTLRVDGVLHHLDRPPITPGYIEKLISMMLTPIQRKKLAMELELDFSYSFSDKAHFRVNIFHERGYLSAVMRLVPAQIRTIEELGLPPIIHKFGQARSGLVLVTGPTGQGKSSTLAAIIDEINHQRADHILTIEDPIEFVYKPDKSMISQRELYVDTKSFAAALKSALREDPNVILVGEMRDLETMEAALTIAETGHLVFATVHSTDAASTADRIISAFPSHHQPQIRLQLSSVLIGVLSQRLFPKVGGGRAAAVEVMVANTQVRALIRDGKTYQLPTAIQTGGAEGMITMNKSINQLLAEGKISQDTLKDYAAQVK